MHVKKTIGLVAAAAVALTTILGVAPASAEASAPAGVAAVAPDVALPDGSVYKVPEAAKREIAAQQTALATSDPATYQEAMAAYEQYTASLADGVELEAPAAPGTRACVTVTKSALIAFAWVAIGYGSLLAAVGGFLDLTIVGLPAGAVLNAVGIGNIFSGTVLLDRANAVKWTSKRICI